MPGASTTLLLNMNLGFAGGVGESSFSVADNEDGTGVTLTITGDTVGAWTFYTIEAEAAFTGTWITSASGSGTTEETVALAAGYHFGYVEFDAPTQPKLILVTTGVESVWQQCLDAVQTVMQMLSLADIVNSDIIQQKVPWKYGQKVSTDKVVLSPWPERRDHQAGSNLLDRTEYGILVTFISPSNLDLTSNLARHLKRRQVLTRAFVNQQLPGVEEIVRMEVEPSDPYPEGVFGSGLDVQGIVVRCIAEEPRT